MAAMVKWREQQRRISKEEQARQVELLGQGRLAAHKMKLAAALAGGTMALAVELDAERQSLTGGDPMLGIMLAEIMANFVRQAHHIQMHMFDGWEL
jgi:hypothetical protein